MNSSELRELNRWLSGNSDSQEVLADFKEIWNSVSSYKAAATFDTNAAFAKFSSKYDLSDTRSSDTLIDRPISNAANQGMSLLRIAMIGITAAALFLGGYLLSSSMTPTISNDSMAARPIALMENVTATLKPNTTLKYDKENNAVSSLNGGAYFNLAKLPADQAMTLDLSNTKIMASQAIINVDNYEDEDMVTSVKKGEITLNVNNKKLNLAAGQSLIVSKANGSHTIVDADAKAFQWETGILVFDDTPLSEVFSQIEKFYGVNVTVKDNSKVTTPITVTVLKDKSLDECLQLLQSTVDMNIRKQDGKEIHITDIKAE